MCCFSSHVTHVSRTRIFARELPLGRQSLAYAMTLAAPSDVAMILPIPVPDGVTEDGVAFVSLESYDAFFDDLERAFPVAIAGFGPPHQHGDLSLLSLAVHRVGAFEASFVPRVADFARLDPRFRLPPEALRAFEGAPHGFVVFKLGEVHASPSSRHPMAFTFPRRDARRLFFPTLHVHDGTLPAQAQFDHTLYAQLDADAPPKDALVEYRAAHGAQTLRIPWRASGGPLSEYVDGTRAAGLVDAARHAFALDLNGMLVNVDTYASV